MGKEDNRSAIFTFTRKSLSYLYLDAVHFNILPVIRPEGDGQQRHGHHGTYGRQGQRDGRARHDDRRNY